jgi:CRP-like cAMP-binding protein
VAEPTIGDFSGASNALLRADVFSEMDERDKFIQYIELVDLPGDSVAINEGDIGDDLLILLNGAAKVVKRTGEFSESIASFDSSGVFGEITFICGAVPRSASVVTIGKCRFIKITRRDYEKVKIEHPAAALEFAEALARRISNKLVETTKRLVEVDRQLNMVARNDGDSELNALRDNISGALFDILGGQPDETWGRFLKLSPEEKEKALNTVKA